jgi:hypothetical protein
VEFFADRDLGRYEFPGALRAAGIVVHAHADHFAQRTPDAEWLPVVAERGWIVLTNDRKIRSRMLEVRAVMTSDRARARARGRQPHGSRARTQLPEPFVKIEALISGQPAPWIARLYRPNPVEGIAHGKPGSVRLIITLDDWKRRNP